MSNKFIAAALLSTMIGTAYADVVVTTPEEIIVVAINGQEVRGGFFGGKENSYRLDAGQHQISVKYQQLFEEGYINHDIVRSGVVTINTGELQDQQQYQLVLIDPPKDHDAAKKFAEQPAFGLKNSAGQLVVQQKGISGRSQPWLSNLFSQNNEVNLSSNKSIVVSQQAGQIVQNTAVSSVASQQAADTVNAVQDGPVAKLAAKDQQLIEIWKSASPQERQKFMAWLTEQASK